MLTASIQYHSSDMTSIFSGGELLNYLIHFATMLEPGSGGNNIPWPRYTVESPELMTILDGEEPLAITHDTYRAAAIKAVVEFSLDNTLR